MEKNKLGESEVLIPRLLYLNLPHQPSREEDQKLLPNKVLRTSVSQEDGRSYQIPSLQTMELRIIQG